MFGWWIPADKEARMESDVLVYFPGGSGSLSARTERIAFWHQQRINVFAFDYRGFGNSEKMRPGQESLQQDAASVARYLTDTRHIPAARMVFYGEGIGCFTAILAANQTPGLGAVILNNPVMSQLGVFEADERTHLVPLHLLSRDMFSLSPGIEQLRAPTMVMTTVGTQQNEDDAKQVLAALHTRKSMLNIPSEGNLLKLTQSVNAFLDATVGSATPTNQGTGPAPAPSPGK
jgi:pimeloyl-ACP methyl ester carboxylesterase